MYWFWGQRTRSKLDFELCIVSTLYLNYFKTYSHQTSHTRCPLLEEGTIDFGVKVKIWVQTVHSFHSQTPLYFDIHWWFFRHVTITCGWRLLILGSKGQRWRSNFNFELCIIFALQVHHLLTYNDDTSHIFCSLPVEENSYSFWDKRY